MDSGNLSQADKYLLYGLLLKKKRNPSEERKLISIMRSSRQLDEKIEAIMSLAEVADKRVSRKPGAERQGSARPPRKRRLGALVVDLHPELTKLLKKCSLKRRFTFTTVAESFDVVHLLRRLAVELVIVNENLSDEDQLRYYEICRAVQPHVRIIYLSSPPRPLPADPLFRRATRYVAKPISIKTLEETVAELLAPRFNHRGKAVPDNPQAAGDS
jgi:CheY-like chemotaxis protein